VGGLRKALIVANDVYEHEGLRHLLAPAADAEALAGVLGDAQIGDFDVHVVRNEPAHVIQGQIEDLFSDSRAEDVLLLHFSCHGLKSESGELFFAARNTRPNRLGSTAISADFVQRCMRASRSRSIVLLLDCCYGGAFSQGVRVRAAGDVNVLDSFPGGRLGGGRGRAVITASSAMEYAFEGDQLADDHSRPSVFTSALVEGLATGDADRDQDGWVSLNELYDYVFDRVRERNPHQTPGRDVEMQGELYLARRSRPVTTPAPLPPELQEVIDHPLANIRAGAVQELARLVRGSHAGLALAAKLAIERLADDDSRMVAAAAAAALVAIDQDQGTAPIGVPAPAGAEPAPAIAEQTPPADEAGRIRSPEAAPQAQEAARPRAQKDAASAADSPAEVARTRPAPESAPAPAAVDITSPAHPAEPAGDATRVAGPTPVRWPARLRRRRLIYVAGAAAVLAAGAAAALLLPDRGDTPRDGGRPGQGEFTAASPWRLVIRDNILGMDNGCTVTVTNTDSGEQNEVPRGVYGTKSFQMHETGSFRWEANDPGCLVTHRSGPGKAVLPFAHEQGGDTDAFEAGGQVAVEVVNFNGNPECKFVLHDAADGRQVDFGSVRQGGGPRLLDPSGRSQVYVANPMGCGIRVSAG